MPKHSHNNTQWYLNRWPYTGAFTCLTKIKWVYDCWRQSNNCQTYEFLWQASFSVLTCMRCFADLTATRNKVCLIRSDHFIMEGLVCMDSDVRQRSGTPTTTIKKGCVPTVHNVEKRAIKAFLIQCAHSAECGEKREEKGVVTYRGLTPKASWSAVVAQDAHNPPLLLLLLPEAARDAGSGQRGGAYSK